jgi:hypothetical protein
MLTQRPADLPPLARRLRVTRRVVALSVSGEVILAMAATVIAGMLAFLQARKE